MPTQVLSYLDFFPTSVQRTAAATAANMCRALASAASAAGGGASSSLVRNNTQAVKEAVPILTGLLNYSDAKVHTLLKWFSEHSMAHSAKVHTAVRVGCGRHVHVCERHVMLAATPGLPPLLGHAECDCWCGLGSLSMGLRPQAYQMHRMPVLQLAALES